MTEGAAYDVRLVIAAWVLLYSTYHVLSMWVVATKGAEKYVASGEWPELARFRQQSTLKRWLRPRFLAVLLLASAALWVIWTPEFRLFSAELLEFVTGMLIMLVCVLAVRQFRNLAAMRRLARSEGVAGHVTYSRWVSLQASAVDALGSAVLLFVIALFTGSWFALGGVTVCMIMALVHARVAWVARRVAAVAPSGEEPEESGS
jgi:hypothetical protein